MDNKQREIKATFMRTGTSKSVYFKKNDLPSDQHERDKLLLQVMGSPDPVQIDGMGGGGVSTSKIAIISPSMRCDADIDYTFGQVSLTAASIDYKGNCGNCSSGVGPFVIDECMVPVVEPITEIRVYNTNTDKVLIMQVPVVNGKAAVDGDYKIDGIPGTGAKINIDFKNTAGAATGKLLPTGNRQDVLQVDGLGKIPVTIMDLGNPIVYVHSKYVGAKGIENKNEISTHPDLLDKIEKIREAGARLIRLCGANEVAAKVTPARPLIVFFNEPMDCTDYVSGEKIPASNIDFVARNIFVQKPIDTFTAIGAVNTALCSIVKGTVLNEVAIRRNPDNCQVVFGNPRGYSDALVQVEDNGEDVIVLEASLGRTARRIMQGYVYVRESQL